MTGHRGVELELAVPTGTFELHRHPARKRSTLRAWDAADLYALQYLAEQPPSGPVAVLNDGFGALAVAMHAYEPIAVADSVLAELGLQANRQRNGLPPAEVHHRPEHLPSGLETVVIKVPKSLGMLEEQLHRLRSHLAPEARILGAGMVRHIHTSTLELFESIIGPTTTSLAVKKARLIHATVDPDLVPPPNPWPMVWKHRGLTVHNHGGVFSATSPDIGTRFLVEHLPPPTGEAHLVVDLGCGNGLLGVAAAVDGPARRLLFIDASAAAIDSARLTWRASTPPQPDQVARAEFRRVDRMVGVVDAGSVDLVLNNPPFHEDRAIGDATAWDMFVDSHLALRPGGELRVVANRHLGHHARLTKIFGNCRTVASNKKFVVLSARR